MPNNPTVSKSIWPFSPQSIASCSLWLDASDPDSVVRTGTDVTTWTDKSGRGNSASAYVSPTYVPNSQNGLATILFDGASTFLTSPLTVDFNQHCLFAVHKPATVDPSYPGASGPGGNTGIFRLQDANGYIIFPYTYDGSYGYINDHGSIGGGLPDNSSVDAFQIITANILSDGSSVYRNGVLQGTNGNSISGGYSATLSIGAHGDIPYQQQFYWGSIAELIVFSGHLTDAERQYVEGYLNHKWGLNALPADNTYYSQPVFNKVFRPVDIPGCSLWLDAADQSSMTFSVDTTVSVWNDKSGNGYNATILPGYTGATFSSTSNALYFPNSTTGYATSYSGNPTNETMFVVFNNPEPSFTNNMVIGGPQGARSLSGGYSGSVGVGACSYLNNEVTWEGIASMPASTYTSGSTVIITGQVVNSWSSSISQNGGTVYSNSGTAFDQFSVNTYIGTDSFYDPPVYYYVGYIMEVIFYNSVLTPSQCQQVEAYLAWKWRIQYSLPTTHPGYRLPAYAVANKILFTPSYLTNLGIWLDPSDVTTLTISGTDVTYIMSKSPGDYQWYSPYGGVIQRTINGKPAFGFLGGCLRNDSVYLPNGYNMSIFAIAQILPGAYVANIFSKGIYLQLKTDGIDVWIVSDDSINGISFNNSGENPMPTSVDHIYFISVVMTSPEDMSQPSCYCTINGVQLSMQVYNAASTIPYGTETYLITDFGDPNYDLTAGESIIYTDNKSIYECKQIEGYFAWKWGAQSLLPSTHPYALTPPYAVTPP